MKKSKKVNGIDPDGSYSFKDIKSMKLDIPINLLSPFAGLLVYDKDKVSGSDLINTLSLWNRRTSLSSLTHDIGVPPNVIVSFNDIINKYTDKYIICSIGHYFLKEDASCDDLKNALSEACTPYLRSRNASRKIRYESKMVELLLGYVKRMSFSYGVDLSERNEFRRRIIPLLSELLPDDELSVLEKKALDFSDYDHSLDSEAVSVVKTNKDGYDPIDIELEVRGKTLNYQLDGVFIKKYCRHEEESIDEFKDLSLTIISGRLSMHLNSVPINDHMKFHINNLGDVTIDSGMIFIDYKPSD